MKKSTTIVNFKTYTESTGKKALRLAKKMKNIIFEK